MLVRQRGGIAKAKAAGKYKGRPVSIVATPWGRVVVWAPGSVPKRRLAAAVQRSRRGPGAAKTM